MKRLQQVFTASGQTYGSLLLDLHYNRLGPSALFQVNILLHFPLLLPKPLALVISLAFLFLRLFRCEIHR